MEDTLVDRLNNIMRKLQYSNYNAVDDLKQIELLMNELEKKVEDNAQHDKLKEVEKELIKERLIAKHLFKQYWIMHDMLDRQSEESQEMIN